MGTEIDRRGTDPRVARSRTLIRSAALAELGEVGYGAFTIESVAARAGVGKSTIYRHWPDKLALIADALESAHDHLVPAIADADAPERIRRLVRHVAEIVADSTFSAFIPALVEGAERDARVRAFHHRHSDERRQGLVDVISDGVASGELPAGLDPELVALGLLGPIFYARLMTGRPLTSDTAERLIELVLEPRYGIRPVGRVESPLVERTDAPRQGNLGAPDAWIVFDPALRPAVRHLRPGSEAIVLTWLHRARRDVLATRPGDDPGRGELGVFATRSPDRPNPIGLHRVRILGRRGLRMRVGDLEAIDGTPVIDVKPVLGRDER